jgi:hypothetical protein
LSLVFFHATGPAGNYRLSPVLCFVTLRASHEAEIQADHAWMRYRDLLAAAMSLDRVAVAVVFIVIVRAKQVKDRRTEVTTILVMPCLLR